MRPLLSILALPAAVLFLAACGSGGSQSDEPPTKITPAQATALKKRADLFAANMNKVAKGASECGQKAKSSQDISTCLAEILKQASVEMTGVVDYTKKLSNSVSGQCKADLAAFTGALDQASQGFATAAKDAEDNDLAKLEKDLGAIDVKQITTIGKKVDASCG